MSLDSNVEHRYLHGAAIDQILADEDAAGNVLWPLTDNLGTVRDLAQYDDQTDTTTIVNHLTYDAFGNITSESNTAIDHLFAYTGRERDEETGLYYYRARYYDPAVGRFVSEDPIGFAAGDPNVYRYVENTTPSVSDPSGLNPNQFGAKGGDEVLEIVRAIEERYRRQHGSYPSWQTGVNLFRIDQERNLDAGSNHYYAFGYVEQREFPQSGFAVGGDGRWIDLRHFSICAYYAGKTGTPSLIGRVGGDALELYQGWSMVKEKVRQAAGSSPPTKGNEPRRLDSTRGSAASAFGVEDAFSNMLGASFGTAYMGRKTRLSTLLESYFAIIRVSNDPKSVESFKMLPKSEKEWHRWRLNPRINSELTTMHGARILCPEAALQIEEQPTCPKPPGTIYKIKRELNRAFDWRNWYRFFSTK